MDELAAPAAASFEGNERLAALRDGLAHLPERQRRGILLREWQGLSYAEIADELGLSLGAVETLLFRARRNLASRLQHVRTGVGAINVATLAPFIRSLARGGLGKLGLIGAGAAVALVPVVATEIAPALAHGKAAVTLRSAAPADLAKTPRLAATARRTGAVVTGKAPRPWLQRPRHPTSVTAPPRRQPAQRNRRRRLPAPRRCHRRGRRPRCKRRCPLPSAFLFRTCSRRPSYRRQRQIRSTFSRTCSQASRALSRSATNGAMPRRAAMRSARLRRR